MNRQSHKLTKSLPATGSGDPKRSGEAGFYGNIYGNDSHIQIIPTLEVAWNEATQNIYLCV